ncbi:CU044_2847 family protein [Spirosoma aerolatum]|uniref:CU044_2847 family protein n=1 Tax=Spirosoma aerolatum TaxID=1211326 RepID=UPI0012D2D8E1|nr:CU044_2847 family protein [Spirosoma aerolatum]
METQNIPLKLDNGTLIYVEVESQNIEENVGLVTDYKFSDITDKIEGIAKAIVGSFEKVRPQKATVEFGINISLEASGITTLIAKGNANSTIRVIFEWNNSK